MLFPTLLTAAAVGFASAQSTFSPLRPPALPLAVKSPYMSTWQQAGSSSGSGGYLAGEWPTFWGGSNTGWTGFVRVDNVTYIWMGDPTGVPHYVNQTAYEYTSTRSIFTMSVNEQVSMNITFLSPVTPNDLLRSSLPYTYMEVDVQSVDGHTHDVSIYTDISAEWVSGDASANAQWSYGSVDPSPNNSAGGIAYHQVFRQQQLNFSETNQQADWGTGKYYATRNTEKLTYQSGQDVLVRGNFIANGSLPDTQDSDYRAIREFPVFAFALNLGAITSQTTSTLFQLSLHQDLCVQFEGAHGTQTVPCLWTSYFDNDLDAVAYFYNDYDSNGTSIATAFDNQVSRDSLAAGGQNYLDLTSLAARQAFGALEYTNTPTSPWVFLKEISSDGNIQTVDVIFPFHPIAIYTNANTLKYMLDPLFINQEAGNWPNQYSIHDLGGAFPNATGHNDGVDEMQALEECGNMLIMTLAYAQRANDNAYLAQHYDILNQWTQFLIEESLVPANQNSTDDFAGALTNATNLAIKGIIGIEAMAQIANRTGHAADGANYTQIARSYVQQWETLSTTSNASYPHTTLNYGNESSYSLLYNIYGDKELGLELVPQSVYDMQSNFYLTVIDRYGVPLDSRNTFTKADWEMFCASVASETTKNKFTQTVSTWLDQTSTSTAFTDLYDVFTGYYGDFAFIARPAVGGMFAFLALNSAPTSGYVTPSNSSRC